MSHSTLLIGNTIDQEKYLEDFINNEKIKSYNILKFEKRIKIADVKQIIKSLSLKVSEKDKRLIILPDDITHDAQNALLKTLEELPDFVNIIICSDSQDKLLPTIISRCKIIRLTNNEVLKIEDEDLKKALENYLKQKDLYAALQLSEKVKNIETLIIALREFIIIKINKDEKDEELKTAINLLNNISEYYPLIITNNLNLRFKVEQILFNNELRIMN